jgi:small-conductance mechanosensitive channel
MDWYRIFQVFTRPLFQLGQTWVSIATIVQFVLVVVLVVVAARFCQRVLRSRVLSHTRLDAGLQYAIARIAFYVVLVLGFMVGLQTLGINLTSFTVIAGALGIGIGFGLQNIVNNFVSGLIILAERPIQVGDRVDVGGVLGNVAHIGARSTSVITNDNIMIIIPNSEFISGRVTNWSIGDPKVRFRIPVGVAYGSDAQLVERVLLEVAGANEHVLKQPAPSVRFIGFGDSALNFELRVWSVEWVNRPGALQSALNFAIYEKFKANRIEIPFPQRDVHLKEPIKLERQPR